MQVYLKYRKMSVPHDWTYAGDVQLGLQIRECGIGMDVSIPARATRPFRPRLRITTTFRVALV